MKERKVKDPTHFYERFLRAQCHTVASRLCFLNEVPNRQNKRWFNVLIVFKICNAFAVAKAAYEITSMAIRVHYDRIALFVEPLHF
jgi:hypothetical protein